MGTLPGGGLQKLSQVKDEFGFASGALRFDLELGTLSEKEISLAVPFGGVADSGGSRS